MTRYRTWLLTPRGWMIGDVFNHWPDVQMALAMHERQREKVIVVVKDSAIDRHILETGKLPPDVKSQLARVGRRIFAQRNAPGKPLTE